jgi:hypothetical protein
MRTARTSDYLDLNWLHEEAKETHGDGRQAQSDHAFHQSGEEEDARDDEQRGTGHRASARVGRRSYLPAPQPVKIDDGDSNVFNAQQACPLEDMQRMIYALTR